MLPGGQVMNDLAEDPWPALRRAADHDAVGARVPEHGERLLRRVYVAVRDDWNGDGPLHRADGVVFRFAGESAGTRTSVQGQRRDAARLRKLGDLDRVAIFRVPA